jgi:hypothetical protein
MRTATLIFKCLLGAYILYILYVLAVDYSPGEHPVNPPFLLFVMDTINLFIHEAGHLFMKPFGMVIYMLGGSAVQVLLPLALLVVTWLQQPRQTPYPAFWVGESMINVSVYIADAPYRKLKLIAPGLKHDWNWLLSDNLEAAEPLSVIVYAIGMLLCVGSFAGFLAFAVMEYRESAS